MTKEALKRCKIGRMNDAGKREGGREGEREMEDGRKEGQEGRSEGVSNHLSPSSASPSSMFPSLS